MKNKKPTTRFLNWIDSNGLAVLAGFLLLFIPLYPKLPLMEAIPGYIVRVRLEDFLILFTFIFWGIQLLRGKAKLHPLLTKLILAYFAIGFLSSLSAIFITRTVPLEPLHVGKLFLHYFRRIEYFSLFFVFYSAIKNKDQAKKLIGILVAVIFGISIYGFGQKYLYWPVYLTMNREFSKGMRLYLTENARVPSTFGGHYDAAAFTMIAITIALSLFFFVKNRWVKLVSGIAYLLGFWLLILTASRTSFIAYLVSISVLMFMALFVRSFKWVIPRWLAVVGFSILVMLSFGDLNDRYAQVLGVDKLKIEWGQVFKDIRSNIKKPDNAISTEEAENRVLTKTDELPTPEKPERKLPGDVYEDIPEPVEVTDEETGEKKIVNKQRTWSKNAEKYGLSAAIRLDALWPRAWEGFLKNPLLGSGYSTLTKEAVGQFTEAESTDNDFLRNLGETGLLGFIAFFSTVIYVNYLGLKNYKKLKEPLFQAFTLGFVAASAGLLLNATYIDVFEASKVALSFWALSGLLVALPHLETNQVKKARAKK